MSNSVSYSHFQLKRSIDQATHCLLSYATINAANICTYTLALTSYALAIRRKTGTTINVITQLKSEIRSSVACEFTQWVTAIEGAFSAIVKMGGVKRRHSVCNIGTMVEGGRWAGPEAIIVDRHLNQLCAFHCDRTCMCAALLHLCIIMQEYT